MHTLDITITAQPKHVAELCTCERARFGVMHDCADALLAFDTEDMHALERDDVDVTGIAVHVVLEGLDR